MQNSNRDDCCLSPLARHVLAAGVLSLPLAAQQNKTVAALDSDRDGALSKTEIANAARSLLRLDKDGNGALSSSELGVSIERRPRRGPRFGGFGRRNAPPGHPLDQDSNRELSATEIERAPATLLAFDGNRDGKLSKAEVDHVFKEPESGGFGRRGGGPTERIAPENLDFKDGVARIADHATFKRLSYQGQNVAIDVHLKGIEFVKFQIEDVTSDKPTFYWMNTNTHRSHPGFMGTIGISRGRRFGPRPGRGGSMRGVLCYRPLLKAPDGGAGLYTFEFEPNDAYPFAEIKLAYDLIVKTAPFMKGRLAYHTLPRAQPVYEREKALYAAAGLPVFKPSQLYEDIAFLPLHRAEAFGRLRLMKPGERPGPRDIVLYPTLPNEMPRVAGVLTAERQTPLSHVNLRAVQDDVPNAFVLGASKNPAITSLIGKYVYYRVQGDGYELREVSKAEVDAHFATSRPVAPQIPERDVTVTDIRPLAKIEFVDWRAFGVKAANLATLEKIGLPPGIVPDGYAVPFAFYDAFMKHNGLYAAARAMRATAGFASDTERRTKALARLRKKIRKGRLPAEMSRALAELQASFPKGTALRCRSSTNNEDLPRFSGAGLYDSATHRPTEGHIAKTIKQVWASLWNFRAYEEREFYRIDHFKTAMGVLVHANFEGELANGVAVSDDVVYQSDRMFYVNAQAGEDLVTNPETASLPEELLLGPRDFSRDRVIRRSNKAKGKPLLDEIQLDELRECLATIDSAFRKLYGLSPRALFAMEVEFKVTSKGQLAIKQARPWVY